MQRTAWMLAAMLVLVGCGSDDGDGDDSSADVDGVCIRDDAQGHFCIGYSQIPARGVADVKSGCADSWGGAFTEAGDCPSEALVGTCTLEGDAVGGADSAVMEVYEPTDADIAENDICGSDGLWEAAT